MRNLLALVLLLLALPANASDLERFLGTYVGRAILQDEAGRVEQERDIDIMIEPFKRGGFRLRWTNVDLVGGRRDVKGVKRHVGESLFLPSSDGKYYVESDDSGPFRDKEELQPMSGDAIRWAQLDATTLSMLAFVLLPDGRYELQITERRLTAEGMEVIFQRVDDGRVVRRGSGRAVRVEQ